MLIEQERKIYNIYCNFIFSEICQLYNNSYGVIKYTKTNYMFIGLLDTCICWWLNAVFCSVMYCYMLVLSIKGISFLKTITCTSLIIILNINVWTFNPTVSEFFFNGQLVVITSAGFHSTLKEHCNTDSLYKMEKHLALSAYTTKITLST